MQQSVTVGCPERASVQNSAFTAWGGCWIWAHRQRRHGRVWIIEIQREGQIVDRCIPLGQRLQPPSPLNQLQDRGVIVKMRINCWIRGISAAKRGSHNHGHPASQERLTVHEIWVDVVRCDHTPRGCPKERPAMRSGVSWCMRWCQRRTLSMIRSKSGRAPRPGNRYWASNTRWHSRIKPWAASMKQWKRKPSDCSESVAYGESLHRGSSVGR